MAHWTGTLAGLAIVALAGCASEPDVAALIPEVSAASLTQEQLNGPTAARLFSDKPTPSTGAPTPIGRYAKGCAAGLVALPESGPTWQAMRLSRNRFWGTPETIDYLQDLSRFAATQPGWAGLYIGDISQPRGGPMRSGHQSHQIGLDADIWMLPPRRLDLSRTERENLSSVSIAPNFKTLSRNWTPQHAAILEAAARDPRTERIFVTAPAKIEMCRTATAADTDWLQKIRPIWGHHFHFHVRLKCPEGSMTCVPQTPTVAELSKGGNGCDETLDWWVTTALEPAKPSDTPATPAPKRRNARELVMAELPAQCQGVLDAPG